MSSLQWKHVSDDYAHEKLLQDDESNPDILENRLTTDQQYCRRNYLSIATKLLFLLLILLGGFVLGSLSLIGRTLYARFNPSLSCSCGSNIAEALALGCRFDAIGVAFLPPHCIDDQLLHEFDTMIGENEDGTWNYWKDPEGTINLNETGILEITENGDPFYSSHKWHIMHCVYNWKKLVRAKDTGVTVENRWMSDKHITHCARMFTLDRSFKEIDTISYIGLNSDAPNPAFHND